MAGPGKLPGQFVDLAGREVAGGEVVGKASVDPMAVGIGRQVAVGNGFTQVVVGEVDQARPRYQRPIGGKVQERPVRAGQRLILAAEQLQEFRFAQPAAGRPDQPHRIADEVRAVALVVRFIAGEDLLVELRDAFGGQVAVDLLAQPFVCADDAKLVQERLEVERVGRLRSRRDALRAGLVERTCVRGQVVGNKPTPLVECQRLDGHRGPVAFGQGVHRAAGQSRNDQPDVGGDRSGQPGQVRGLVSVLELVQGVEHKHHATAGRGYVEPVGKLRAEIVRLGGDLAVDVEPAPQFAHDASEHGDPVGAVGRGADEVHQQGLVALLAAISQRPVGQQGTLARAGLAQDHQRRPLGGGVVVEPGEVFIAANVDPCSADGERLVLGRLG